MVKFVSLRIDDDVLAKQFKQKCVSFTTTQQDALLVFVKKFVKMKRNEFEIKYKGEIK